MHRHGLALVILLFGCSKPTPFGYDSALQVSPANARPVDSYQLSWPVDTKVRLEVRTDAFDGWLDAPELTEVTRKIDGKSFVVEGKVAAARAYRVTIAAAAANQSGVYKFISTPQPASIAYASAAQAAAQATTAPAAQPVAARRRNEGRSQRAADSADADRRKREWCVKCQRQKAECIQRGGHDGQYCLSDYEACVRTQGYNNGDCGY
jgi:hypothetical protein